MTETRKIKTLKDTNYFAHGTYKKQFKNYMEQIGITNIIARTVLAPLERWRIIKQTQIAYPLRPVVFKNAIDYISRIPKEQGVTAFWRGNMAGLGLFFTQSLIQVGCYDTLRGLLKDIIMQQQPGSLYSLISQRIFIPVIASFCTQAITYPIDTARVRMSMNFSKQLKNSQFYSVRTCLKHIRSQLNFAAMYKGYLLSNAISIIHFNLFLAFSSAASSIAIDQNYSDLINADTVSAVGALALIYPLDTIKKIVQLDNLSSPSIIKNARDAVQYIKRQGSYVSLYKGFFTATAKSLLFLPTFYLANKAVIQTKTQIKF